MAAILGLAGAPGLLPSGGVPEPQEPWPFSLVPSAAWRGYGPTAEEAGNVVPVEFRLGGYRGLDVLSPKVPHAVAVDCDTGAPRVVAAPTSGAARGVLTYDWFTDAYTFWWPRPEGWIGTCRTLMLSLRDGTLHPVMIYFGAEVPLLIP